MLTTTQEAETLPSSNRIFSRPRQPSPLHSPLPSFKEKPSVEEDKVEDLLRELREIKEEFQDKFSAIAAASQSKKRVKDESGPEKDDSKLCKIKKEPSSMEAGGSPWKGRGRRSLTTWSLKIQIDEVVRVGIFLDFLFVVLKHVGLGDLGATWKHLYVMLRCCKVGTVGRLPVEPNSTQRISKSLDAPK